MIGMREVITQESIRWLVTKVTKTKASIASAVTF